MAEEELEIILRAVDEASDTFESVKGAAENMGDSVQSGAEAGSKGLDGMEESAEGAVNQVDKISNSLNLIDASALMSVAEQVRNITNGAEGAAQGLNDINIQVGQLATMTGMAEGEMNALIRDISNVTFPQEEAAMYVKSLTQMGVANENLGSSATNIDKINDAFGLGADRSNRLAQELGVLGVDMNNVSESFNALAYANKNTVGGMQNYFTFLQRYDAQLKELGYNVDQTSIIIAAATQKYGGGRAALSGLSNALKEAGEDSQKLEESLGLQAGTLDNASSITGKYKGQLKELANEEMEHKTILERLQAAVDDIALGFSGVLTPVLGFASVIGGLGTFGLQVKGLQSLTATLKKFTIVQNLATVASSAYSTVVAVLTGELGLVEAATMAWNAVLAMNPVVWVAVAAVGLAVAIYEVGKAFGWWTDVSSMIDAIWAGVQRLWSAFINHPDVQGLLSAMGQAWGMILPYIQSAFRWVMSFFTNANSSGRFDFVRSLINAIGAAWQALTAPIRLIIKVIQLLWTTTKTAGNNIRNTINNIHAWFAALPSQIRSAISTIASILLAPFSIGYQKIAEVVGKIIGKAKSITSIDISGVTNKLTEPFSKAYTNIVGWAQRTYKDAQNWYDSITTSGHAAGSEELLLLNAGIKPNTNYSTNGALKVDQDIKLTLDLANVPANVDEEIIYGLIRESFSDKTVLNALVNNTTFQDLDKRVKNRISMRNNRAKGGSV